MGRLMSDNVPEIPQLWDHISLGSGEKSIDMDVVWKALRKLSNKNINHVCKLLFYYEKTFSEIQEETGLTVNDVNHALYDLKQHNLVIMQGDKRGERTYHLTSYCVILLETLDILADKLKTVEAKDIFDSPKKP